MTQRQRDKHLLALCYFNCRDFGMAVQTLAAAKHPTMLFLRLYSQFLMASRKLNFDRRLSSERNQSSDKPRQPDPSSPLAPLYFEMQQLKENRELTDPFIMYLYGLVSLKLELVDVGLEALGQSLAIYPHNWSAWIEFFPCANQDGISRPHFSKMKSLIRHCLPKRLALLWENDPLGDEDLVVEAERMELIFKNNIYLRLAKARLLYYLSDYEQCRQIWKSLYQENPYLLDMADNYSDVLYTMQCRVELNAFVQRCDKIDRFRPETCCAIANFFALRGEYPKAIDYIKQAIKLHSSNSSYWVVLGLFYADLKNPNAAIEAYRTAIEIDKTNHKAWNMLGVSYNMLQIPSFAIFYFKRALTLKDDPRYWSGLGSCYANLDRDHEAIACYRRAILQTDPLEYSRPEAAAMMEMAKLNERIGRLDLAEKCFANLFAHYEMKDNFVDLQEAVDAAVFLARRAIDDGRWGDAARYAEKIAESEEGRSLLNKIGSRNR
ncbi:hypothetical protein DFJ73DRAFT_840452 [Zopfochytrium polystomum]|nr:hypothetical protein DFJ73DRAFT_840452 [Zopfochytrium polystomum]